MFRLAIRLAKWMITLFLLIGCAVILLLLYLWSQPLPYTSLEGTTVLYSSEGEIIDAQYGGINRQPIVLEKIPEFIQQATIAVEDRSFYKHLGFDPKRIAGAVLTDIKAGKMVQGASTITQQLARNLYLSHEKTWDRKIKEAMISIQLELQYSKKEILEMYLNQIYYGNGAYGIQSAALAYFGKDVSQLSLAEGTLLVGIPKGPTYYEPYGHFDNAKKRQKIILNAMVEMGYLTRAEADQAYQEELHLVPKEKKKYPTVAPYFRDAVMQWVKKELNLDQDQLSHAGLKIYTTLSLDMQQKAERIIAEKLPKDRPLQVALVAMEPSTGYIRAMVGGRDYKESQYNRAYAKRQPGSTFKPFLYLTALEKGMTPLTEVESKPTVFNYDGKYYIPSNYHDHYANDYITMLEAIKKSDNIYAVSTLMALGEEQLVERAEELGITSELKALPSIALGSYPLSPVTMVDSYATLANLGEKVEPILVERIEDRHGNLVYEAKTKKTRVADPRHVYVLNQMLQAVFDEGGTGYRVVSLLNRPAAGKTGTTPQDAWMLGFTPQLTAGVWVGFDQNEPLSVVDAHLAAPIWAEFMESALSEEPPMIFQVPDGLVSAYIDLSTKQLATENCPQKQLLYFIPGTLPTEFCTEHPASSEKKETPPKKQKKSFWERLKEWW